MDIVFEEALRENIKLKISLYGISNSGKTYSSLLLARGLVGPQGKIAFVDTENRRALLYNHITKFNIVHMSPPFHPLKYSKAIDAAIENKFDVVILDSISHEWAGEGGILDIKGGLDEQGGNQFANWKAPTDLHNQFINNIIHSDIHVISCMRTKSAYVMSENERGKTVPKKMGLAPVQREGVDYEFDFTFDIASNHKAKVTKHRADLFPEEAFKITEETGSKIKQWLDTGPQEKEVK